MEVVEVEMRGVTVLTVKGRMDSNTSGEIEPVLVERANARRALVVDLKHVQYISSAGLRVLLKTAKASRGSNNRLALAALTPQVEEVFEISGFKALFEIFDDADKATVELG